MAVFGEEAGWVATASLRGHGCRWAELAESPLWPHGEGRELTGATASAHCRGSAARRAHRADTEPPQGLHGRFSQTKASRTGKTNTSVTLETPRWSSG